MNDLSDIRAELRDALSSVLVRHVEPMFVPGMLLTLVARIPGDPTKTVIVSSDDISAVVTAEVLGETA